LVNDYVIIYPLSFINYQRSFIMSLAKYSLDNTKIIYFFLAVLLIGGITSFGKLGKKEDAPFVIKSAGIMTPHPGAGGEHRVSGLPAKGCGNHCVF